MHGPFYVTTPIYYVNAKPHLGHLYTTLVADTLHRYMRQRGADSFFLTGTDEHGINIERAAAAAGISVKAHVDANAALFKEMVSSFEIEPSRFIRTTDPAHELGAQHLYSVLKANGHIYKGEYEGLYCAGCNQYYTDTEALTQGDVRICPTHERPLDVLKEQSWFFRLSAFEGPLLEHYAANPDFVRPRGRANEVISFVSSGLQDLSVSRAAVSWGIPVPGDPDHTLYVWLDALSNYITALGYGNSTYDGLDTYWPATLQLVGKDILRFHAVYWPAFLMGAGLPLPGTVFAHGMWLSGGRKMSKSLGNVIDLPDLKAHFSLDTIRYFCLREMAFGDDADFNYPALINRHNGDLAGGLGNLVSRSLTLVRSGLGGHIAMPAADEASAEVVETAARAVQTFNSRMEAYEFNRALEGAWELIGATDRYIAERKPWALAKDASQADALSQCLAVAAEALRVLAVLLQSVMPSACATLWSQLGLEGSPAQHDPAAVAWGQAGPRQMGELSGLFPRLNADKLLPLLGVGEAQVQAAPQAKKAAAKADAKVDLSMPAGYTPGEGADNPLDYNTFLKSDIRVGLVLAAEPHPNAERLLKLSVDVGEGVPRQICAGIAGHYAPEDLLGKRVMVVTNLAPRKLRGLVSQGMILAASEGEDGRPYVVHPPESVPVGGRVR